MAGLPKSYLYVGIKGHLLALDRATGAERWRTKLKGSEFVYVVSDGDHLFAAARGELFCVDAASGRIIWRNPLSGLGLGLASILAAGGQGPMDGSMLLAVQEAERRRAAAAAGG